MMMKHDHKEGEEVPEVKPPDVDNVQFKQDRQDDEPLPEMQSRLDELISRLEQMEAEKLGAPHDNSMGPGVGDPGDDFQVWIPGEGGGSGPYLIYLVDGTSFTITNEQAMTGYDPTSVDEGGEGHTDWSLEFPVSSNSLDGAEHVEGKPEGDPLHDADASADPVKEQTYYRLPIIRDGQRVSVGGAYREKLSCDGARGAFTMLERI